MDFLKNLFKDIIKKPKEEVGEIVEWSEREINDMTHRELQKELKKRHLDTRGTKKMLRRRLNEAVQRQRDLRLNAEAALEKKRLIELMREARGAVYAIGRNDHGQLGLHDKQHRYAFCLLKELYDGIIVKVAAGVDTSFALDYKGDIYGWGGGGVGPLGTVGTFKPREGRNKLKTAYKVSRKLAATWFTHPKIIPSLDGEEIIDISVGETHGLAVSKGGDVFAWGDNSHAQLGQITDSEGEPLRSRYEAKAKLCDLPVGVYAATVCCGSSHSVCLSSDGGVYCWGDGANGKLGIGVTEQPVPGHTTATGTAILTRSWRIPTEVRFLRGTPVLQLACSSSHAIALTRIGVFSWGAGDSGKLGHGDKKDQILPKKIEALEKEVVVQVYASRWYSMVIVCFPPMRRSGYVFAFGSGFVGQLGLDDTYYSPTPTLVQSLVDLNVTAKYLCCGTYHVALVSSDDELYTWGQNNYNCLGRVTDTDFTAQPGHVKVFNVIVDRNPRGKVRSVACGHDYTLVATMSYDGPDEDEVDRLQDEEIVREEAERRAERERKAKEGIKKVDVIGAAPTARTGLLCDKCGDTKLCSGFVASLLRPNICRECNHLARLHNTFNPLADMAAAELDNFE